MLEEGKITVDEAAQLLEALREGPAAPPEEPQDQDRGGRGPRQRWRESTGERAGEGEGSGTDVSDDMEAVKDEVHERIVQAREAIRRSMPRVRQAVQDAMPEVERAVQEAMAAMPDVGRAIRDAVHAATEATADWSGAPEGDFRYSRARTAGDLRDHPHAAGAGWPCASRAATSSLKPGTGEDVQVDARIEVRATTRGGPELCRRHPPRHRPGARRGPHPASRPGRDRGKPPEVGSIGWTSASASPGGWISTSRRAREHPGPADRRQPGPLQTGTAAPPSRAQRAPSGCTSPTARSASARQGRPGLRRLPRRRGGRLRRRRGTVKLRYGNLS